MCIRDSVDGYILETETMKKCYYFHNFSRFEHLKKSTEARDDKTDPYLLDDPYVIKEDNIPKIRRIVYIGIDENGELKRYDSVEPTKEEIENNNGEIPVLSPREYLKWKENVVKLELDLIKNNGFSFIEDKTPSPLDLEISEDTVVAFKLVPESWVFSTEKIFEINKKLSWPKYEGVEKPEFKYPPFHLENSSPTQTHANEYKTIFVRFFPKSPKNEDNIFGRKERENCSYKYDLPVIVRSDKIGDTYLSKTDIIIDPVITNTGGPD